MSPHPLCVNGSRDSSLPLIDTVTVLQAVANFQQSTHSRVTDSLATEIEHFAA
jgi:hypothetical protein